MSNQRALVLSMDDPKYLEAGCLEALRLDREKWAARMPRDLFTAERKPLYDAIMSAGDPSDPAQIVWAIGDDRNTRGVLAKILVEEICFPVCEAGVETRLARLAQIRRRERLRQTLQDGLIGLDQGEAPADLAEKVSAAVEDQVSVLGPFAGAQSLAQAPGELPQIQPLVRKVVYKNGISCISGPGGLGKSWLGIWMGLCLAQGEFWLGLQCVEQRVGYVCLEMPTSAVLDRVKKLTGGKMAKEAQERFHYVCMEHTGRAVDIEDEMFRMALASWVKERAIDVLIVDPLRNTHKRNENDATEMGMVLRCFSQLGCAVVLTHHVARGEGNTRGSTAIVDWCDAVLNLREDTGQLWLGWEKRPRMEGGVKDMKIELTPTADRIMIERGE